MPCTNHPEVEQELVRCLRCRRPFCPDCRVLLRGYWYCGECKEEQVRDIQSGTTAFLELASIGRRFAAWLLDFGIVSCATWAAIVPFVLLMGGAATLEGGGKSDEPSPAMIVGLLGMYAVMFVVSMGLPIVYEGVLVQRRGQTLGKMALGIKIVSVEGGELSTGQAWGRSGMKVGLSSMCSCLGLLADDLPAFFNPEKTALHDQAAQTRVVRLQS